MKAFVLFILLCIGGRVVAQPPNIILQYGVIDNSSYLSTSVAAATYAPIIVTQIYTSGTTVTINNATTWFIVNPSGTVSTLAITFPLTPYDAQKIEISFGGYLTTGIVIVTVTMVANTGQTIMQAFTPDVVNAGENLIYRYNLSQKIWYRL